MNIILLLLITGFLFFPDESKSLDQNSSSSSSLSSISEEEKDLLTGIGVVNPATDPIASPKENRQQSMPTPSAPPLSAKSASPSDEEDPLSDLSDEDLDEKPKSAENNNLPRQQPRQGVVQPAVMAPVQTAAPPQPFARVQTGPVTLAERPAADRRIKRILNRLKAKFRDYYIYFIEPQIGNDAGSSSRNPIKFKIGSQTASSLAEEVTLSTAYAAFFCNGAPPTTWVSFSTFVNKTQGEWRRLGFNVFMPSGDIRALTKTVTTDCGSMYDKMCLQDMCQSGLCGFPTMEMVGAVCGLCHEKGAVNPRYALGTRRCEKDYVDAFIDKIGAHEYKKAQREGQAVNPAYYQYGRPSLPPRVNFQQQQPAWGQNPPPMMAPFPGWVQQAQPVPTYGPPSAYYRRPYGY